MIKKIVFPVFVLFISIAFCSCCDTTQKGTLDQKKDIPTESGNIAIIVIDGCEYIHFNHSKQGGLTHKGNCKNPIHEWNKKN